MGILGWLRRPPTKPSQEISYGRTFVSIHKLDYYGSFSRSRSGQYTVSWRDRRHDADGNPVAGRYLLIRDNLVIVDGRAERPQHGKVADNGTFIFNDWLLTDELCGRFCAFRADGTPILSQTFSANLVNNGLSDDGCFAVCQTANSKTDDSSILTAFDLEQGVEIARWKPETGWADRYEFEHGFIRLCYQQGQPLAYSFTGEPLAPH